MHTIGRITLPNFHHDITVDRKIAAEYNPGVRTIRVGDRGPVLFFAIDETAIIQLSTLQAWRTGCDLVTNAGSCIDADSALFGGTVDNWRAQLTFKLSPGKDGNLVVLTINGREIELLPRHATQLGGSLLRRADTADDWQLDHKQRAFQ